jgi:hypothetical protein
VRRTGAPSRRRSASFPCLCSEPRWPASASAKQGPTKETTAPFGLLRRGAATAYRRKLVFCREARVQRRTDELVSTRSRPIPLVHQSTPIGMAGFPRSSFPGEPEGLGKAMARALANAGASVAISSRHDPELRSADEVWDHFVELNLSSWMALTRALFPKMKSRKWGHSCAMKTNILSEATRRCGQTL